MINIDKIYCINLKNRVERKNIFKKRLSKTEILDLEKTKFIKAINGNSLSEVPDPFNEGWPGNTKGAYGCLLSHGKAVQDAKDNNYERILIFEDDVTFHENFKEKIIKVMDNVPPYWTAIFLGGNVISEMGIININPFIGKCQSYGAHAYMIHKSHYNTILNWIKNPDSAIDVFYANNIQNLPSSFICSPRLCGQSAGYSDIEERDVNHREVLGGI